MYAANATSAGLEAAWLGLPVVIAGNRDGINLNSLMGREDVVFVRSVEDLLAQLDRPRTIELSPDAYLLHPDLPIWRTLLSS